MSPAIIHPRSRFVADCSRQIGGFQLATLCTRADARSLAAAEASARGAAAAGGLPVSRIYPSPSLLQSFPDLFQDIQDTFYRKNGWFIKIQRLSRTYNNAWCPRLTTIHDNS